MALSNAEKQRRYREKRDKRLVELETQFWSTMRREVGKTLSGIEANDFIAIFYQKTKEEQAEILHHLVRCSIEPRNFRVFTEEETLFVVEPYVRLNPVGELVFSADLAAAPAGA